MQEVLVSMYLFCKILDVETCFQADWVVSLKDHYANNEQKHGFYFASCGKLVNVY